MSLAGSTVSEREVKDWIAQSVELVLQEKVDELLAERLAAFVQANEQRARELSLMERVVRVEEELRALKEVQITHFQASEKRFEALQREMAARFEGMQRENNTRFEAMDRRFEAMEKRFEAMDKRFEALQREMNARFETVDKRFEAMDKRFEALQREMNARFEAVDRRFEAMDKRFEALQREMAARFEGMQRENNARFEVIDKRFTQVQWMIGLGVSLIVALIGAIRLFG